MDTEKYTYLIFDKDFKGDSSYSNCNTSKYTFNEIINHKYIHVKSNEINFEDEKIKLDKELYKIYIFEICDVKITLIGINNNYIETLILKNNPIPNEDFLQELCRHHILYQKYELNINISIKSDNNKNELRKIITNITTNAMKPNGDLTDKMIEQPTFTKMPLWDYQKRTINWLLEREKKSENINAISLHDIKIGNIIYDTINKKFTLAHKTRKITFNGGALIDEVGLGKTIQMITMSLLNPPKNISYINSSYDKIFSKATLVICPNQLAIQWNNEFKKMIDDKLNLSIIPLFTKTHFDKYTYQDLLDADFVIVSYNFLNNPAFVESWLSLPSILSKKIKHAKSYLNSVIYSSEEVKKLLDKLTIELKDNIFNELNNAQANLLLIHWNRIIIDEFHEATTIKKYNHVSRLLQFISSNYKWCVSATPFESNYNPEEPNSFEYMFNFVTNYSNKYGFDIFLTKNIQDYMLNNFFRRNTKKSIMNEYNIPAPRENIIWLNFSKTEWMIYNAYLVNQNLQEFDITLRQICCHPMIADELKTTLSGCKTLEEIEKMMVSHYEKQMTMAKHRTRYNELKLELYKIKQKKITWKRYAIFLRKAGYDVSFNFTDTINMDELKKLKEILNITDDDDNDINNEEDENDMLINDKDKGRQRFTIANDNINKVLTIIKSKTDWDKSETPKYIINMNLICDNFKQRYETALKDYEGKKKTYDYYNDVMNRLKTVSTKQITYDVNVDSDSDSDYESDSDEEGETCGVCLGDVKGIDVGVTKCGHIFCYQCVKPFVDKNNRCPMCQKSVLSNEIYKIAQKIEKENDLTDKDFNDKQKLISKVGTKLANMIYYLKNNSDKHAIIFSQWDDLLKRVGDILDSYGIKNVFCKGNVWQRGKAINDFNTNDDIKIIMLSSESAASGTNLTKAGIVILLDPVYGSYEHRKNTEWQAIGRACRMGQTKQVEIVRFIVRNTTEEKLYNLNKLEDAKNKTSVKIFEINDDSIELKDNTKITQVKEIKSKSKKEVIEEESVVNVSPTNITIGNFDINDYDFSSDEDN